MDRFALIKRVRTLTRDLSNSIFREQDIIDFLNESVDRFKQVIPQLDGMPYLDFVDSVPAHLPTQYHSMLAIYATSRCFGQDERHYQATNFMNEFETKLGELQAKVESGEIIITDPTTGLPVDVPGMNETEYVVDNYYFKRNSGVDTDEGVEGVE